MTSLAHISDQTEELCIEAVTIEPKQLKYVIHKTKPICKAAIESSSYAIKYADNPDEDLCWLALKGNVNVIRHIKNPTKEMLEYVAKINPRLLASLSNIPMDLLIENYDFLNLKHRDKISEYLETLSEDGLLRIIQQQPKLFCLIENPSHEMIMTAITQNPDLIGNVSDPTKEMINMVAGKTMHILPHMELNTYDLDYEEICLDAVSKWPDAIMLINNPTDEMLYIAVKTNPCVLRYYYSEELAWMGLKSCPRALRHIKEATREMLEYILNRDVQALQYYNGVIPKDLLIEAFHMDAHLIIYCPCDYLPEDLAWKILERSSELINYIPNATEEMKQYASAKIPQLLHKQNLTEDDIWTILEDDPSHIDSISDHSILTDEMIRYAVERYSNALSYVEQSEELIDLALAHHFTDHIIDQIADIRLRLAYRKRFS